jgi:HK97 family phage prohead protease
MKFKGVNTKLEDFDLNKGEIVVYLSAFGNVDSDGDVIKKGAFRKSLLERGPQSAKSRIKYLAQHDPYRPIGKWLEMTEDEIGLRAVGKLATSTRDGKDYFEFYKEGIITEHSIGFEVVQGVSKADHYEIAEIKLWEGSAVTWGANENTPVLAMAKAHNMEPVNYIESRMERLYKFLRNGEASDEAFETVELEIKTLFTELKALASKGPNTPPPAAEPLQINLVELFNNS